MVTIEITIKDEQGKPISPTVDIYDSETEEILLFDDGIGVKKQKAHPPRRGLLGVRTEQEEHRERHQNIITLEPSSSGKTETSDPKKSRKKVITDVVLLETPKGSFE